MRTLALFVVLVASACTDPGAGRIHEPETVSAATSVAIEPVPCGVLDEAECQSRSDCEAVYDPTSTALGFLYCQDKPPACVKEGELCTPSSAGATDPKCCDGLFCCPGAIVNDGHDHCYAACPA